MYIAGILFLSFFPLATTLRCSPVDRKLALKKIWPGPATQLLKQKENAFVEFKFSRVDSAVPFREITQ